MKRLFWALAAALMMFAPAALAQTAQEITDTCTLSAVGKKTLGRMTDGQYQTYWASSSGSYAYVEIEAEESVGGLYVQFYEDIAGSADHGRRGRMADGCCERRQLFERVYCAGCGD